MSDVNAAPAAGMDNIVSVPASAPAEGKSFALSATEAAKQLSDFRWKRDNPDEKAEEAPVTAADPPQEPAQADDAQPETADPVEATEQQPEPEALPPIEPPRSWTKEDKEEFATYPREAQEKIARREQDREATLRRSQNEAAEARKGIDAERSKVEQARQQYEAALPALLQTLQDQQAGEFSDIRTMADVERLAREDWPRYALWDAQQKKVAAVTQEVNAAKERQVSEFRSQWSEFASKQDQLLLEAIPELADKTKSSKVADNAVAVLKEIGFSEKELASAWNGENSVSLRDHRIQRLIFDAMKYREAKASASKVAPKTVPPVQRPGVSKAPTSANDAEIQTLEKRFNSTGNLKDAAALRLARQRSRA